MLIGIHLLLTYTCNLKCDHCFLYCSPRAKGTMTLEHITTILEEAKKIGTVQEIFFEGGEPFLFYPLMLEGIRRARGLGFKAGIVTNGYWATEAEDAVLWLKPLSELGLFDLTISDDNLHYGDVPTRPSQTALAAGKRLGIPTNAICKARPEVKQNPQNLAEKGTPEITGGIKLRGRAVEKYAGDLPVRPFTELTKCPYEDLAAPKRVHIDAFGNVHICQGITIGNCRRAPLAEIMKNYDPSSHPICGPLLRGGPVCLAAEHQILPQPGYVDECHFCYAIRLALLDRFPQHLGPNQVYGLEEK